MATATDRSWTAQIVLASEHAGIAPEFKTLEHEMYRVLARVDNPRHVRAYLVRMRDESRAWLRDYEAQFPEK